MNPLKTLMEWVREERVAGIPFSHGAVLGTVAADGSPRTRMLGVHFDLEGRPRFHTPPDSRKVADLAINPRASLTFSFQRSLRSVSLEGELEPIPESELDKDWLALDPKFRRSYLVFGHVSGQQLASDDYLDLQLQRLPPEAEAVRPASFIGYRFAQIQRVAFYAVGSANFACHDVYHFQRSNHTWVKATVVP